MSELLEVLFVSEKGSMMSNESGCMGKKAKACVQLNATCSRARILSIHAGSSVLS